MSSGNIVQIIGAVVDVEFPSDAIPKIYDALIVDAVGVETTLEVQQQIGDGVVRTIALGSTDGLHREQHGCANFYSGRREYSRSNYERAW